MSDTDYPDLLAPIDPTEPDPGQEGIIHEGWKIENVSSLEWALGRLAELKARNEAIDAAATEARKRVEARAEQLTAKVNRGIAYFTAHIEKYATEHRDEILGGGKAKSREFIHGTVGWRKRSGRLVVVDDQALRGWLVEQGDDTLYRVKIEPEMQLLQARFRSDGVIPPGCEFVADTEKFYMEALDPERMLPKGDKP